MYSSNEPVYVSDPRKRTLVVFAFLVVLALLFGYAAYTAYLNSPSSFGNYAYALVFPLFAIVVGYAYLKTTRVEFYDNFARIFGRRGAPNKDYRYSDFDLGPLISGGGGYSFRIYSKGGKKALTSVRNVRLEKMDTTLYSFIQAHASGTASNLSVASMPKTVAPKSFLKRHPFLVAALVALALMITGPYYFWNISGPRGTPLIDAEIGLGFFFGGMVVLLVLNFVRSRKLRQGTDR